MNLAKILLLLIAGFLLGVFLPHRPAKHDSRTREFYAWEKTPQAQYKQVRKNYFMDNAICKNVVDVLNDMSTKQPASNWILSHTTNSTFECWPADVDPNRQNQEFSTFSDQPIPTNVAGANPH
jgi:hypothetical protein